MHGLKYEIFHIKGEENRLADLGSRWGNRYAKQKLEEAGLRGGPRPLMMRVLRTKFPVVDDEVRRPDRDLGKGGLLPMNEFTLTPSEIRAAQDRHEEARPAGLRQSQGRVKVWENQARQAWIPDAETTLKRRAYALAHQGIAGHRGRKATMDILASRFFWTDMEKEAECWRDECLHCIKLASGDMVPRPLGSQLLAEKPGEIISADYIKMDTSRTGYKYVLMIVDRLSRLVWFVPTVGATAIAAARALIRWSSQHGLPAWLISDGGSHFNNDVFKELTKMLGIEHHITLAYCPWSNGSVEIVGKDLVWTARALTSEFRASLDEWDLVLPAIEFCSNNRHRDVLGGLSALEVMNGRKPATPVNLALWSGVKMKDAKTLVARTDRIKKHCARLERSLARLHEAVRNETEARLRRKALREARRPPGMNFRVGDYVMVTTGGNQASKKRTHKLSTKWQGPYEVLAGSPPEYRIRLLGDDAEYDVHWRKMVRLAGPDYEPTEEVIASALHDRQRFVVQSFDDWLVDDDGEVELLVRWRHHSEEERTWEPLLQLVEDVAVKVRQYVEVQDDATLTQAHDDVVAAVAAAANDDDDDDGDDA